MGTTIFCLLVLAAVAIKAATPEQRAGWLKTAAALLREVKEAAALNRRNCTPFYDALQARGGRALLTPALAAVNAIVLVLMVGSATPLGSPETLTAWGGNVGLHTTNGEWWRLLTSLVVHTGVVHLLVNTFALLQLGFILERFVGPATFASTYVAAGVFGNLAALRADAVVPRVGASGAIFGLYGLLLATMLWCSLQRAPLTVPRVALKRLTPAAVLFLLYNVTSDALMFSAELTGLTVGAIAGLALARGIGEAMPPWRRVAVGAAAALAVAAASAVPLRGVTDMRPEIERLMAMEERAFAAYSAANEQFNKRRLTADAVATVIETTIVPELQEAASRVTALDRVPPEHKPLLAGAEEYVKLRAQSWQYRIQGLRNTAPPRQKAGRVKVSATENARRSVEAQHTTRMAALSNAEFAERAARVALERITPAGIAREQSTSMTPD